MAGTREALIEAASDLVKKGGPAAVTLREVGRRAGVSHNAPYKHFADKEDLLAAVAARELSRQHVVATRLRRRRTPLELVRAMLHGYVHEASANPEMFKLIYGPWQTTSAEVGSAAGALRSSLVDAVSAAQADGDLPAGDSERQTAMLLALAHGAADLALAGHLSKRGKGNADAIDLIDDALALIGPRPSEQGTTKPGGDR